MFGLIIWIIIIYIIVVKVGEQKKITKKISSSQNTSIKSLQSNSYSPQKTIPNTQRSSYYRPDKVDSYKRMNADHAEHDGNNDEEDLVNTIGYIKCPHCGATVSKKSDTCFMCDKSIK